MKERLRTFRRKSGIWYLEDTSTQRQESLRTGDEKVADAILAERRKALSLPDTITVQAALNVVRAANPGFLTRTWADVFDAIIETKAGPTQVRWIARRGQGSGTRQLFETFKGDEFAFLWPAQSRDLLILRPQNSILSSLKSFLAAASLLATGFPVLYPMWRLSAKADGNTSNRVTRWPPFAIRRS